MADKKKKGFVGEFKEFIMRGNVVDMAVGIIIGGAFTAIVNSLVDDIINPLIALIGGDAVKNIDQLSVTMAHGVELHYGNFIGAIINFLLVALVLFAIVKGINSVRSKADKLKDEAEAEAAAEEEAAPAPTEAELLTQIRDLLAKETDAPAAEAVEVAADAAADAPEAAPQA